MLMGCHSTDVNAIVGGFLRDLAYAQSSKPQMFGYKRAAAAILGLETPLPDFLRAEGRQPKISGIGPASSRVIQEVLDSGSSPTVERAVEASGQRVDIERRRALRQHFLSRAAVLAILRDSTLPGPTAADYRGDLQMHSEWSDGGATLGEIADACHARGYHYAAVTDHSHGLKIAGGMSMQEAAEQRRAIDEVNARRTDGFCLLQGIEANIGPDGQLDLSADEAARFELVLAAPHSRLRRAEDQTARMLAAITNPAVRILAHPRGRISGSRAGVIADWNAIFAQAAELTVAIEIDGDPARQDLDYDLARRALDAGCLFALDSDAHMTDELSYSDTALAHARLAAIPTERIVNCWALDRLLAWLPQRITCPRVSSLLFCKEEKNTLMEQKKINQERSRKYGGSSSFLNNDEPSKAPRQDEDGGEPIETTEVVRQYDDDSKQGISNRSADEEHAFPESEPGPEADAPDSVETTPKQVGGNRGGV
jgi:histidinol phosphatase-like PHP family hydrolase